MAKNVNGGVIVINTLVPANNSKDYPVVYADDIQLLDGTILEDKIKELEKGGGALELSEIDDTLISSYTTWSSENLSEKFSNLRDTLPSYDEVYLKGEVYTKQETTNLIDEKFNSKISSYYTSSEVDGKIQQSAELTLTEAKNYVDSYNTELNNEIASLKDKVRGGITEIGADFIFSLFEDE